MKPNHKMIKFKSNLKCAGYVVKITPSLNESEGISEWKADLADKDKMLFIHS